MPILIAIIALIVIFKIIPDQKYKKLQATVLQDLGFRNWDVVSYYDEYVTVKSRQALDKYDDIKYFKEDSQNLARAENIFNRKTNVTSILKKFLENNEYKTNSQYKRLIKQIDTVLNNASAFRVCVRYISSAGNNLGSREIIVNKYILNKFKIYSCKTVFLNGTIYAQSAQHSPIYGYYFGKKENIEQWRIYMPKRKEFRFIGNVPTKTIQGYKQLPKTGKVVVITKSMKDSMLLSSLGIPAIAPNSETQFVSEKMLEELKSRFKNIVLLYDSDLTGVRFMNKIRKQHHGLIVCMIPRKYEAKDISDFYQKYGRNKTISIIKDYINYLKHEEKIA